MSIEHPGAPSPFLSAPCLLSLQLGTSREILKFVCLQKDAEQCSDTIKLDCAYCAGQEDHNNKYNQALWCPYIIWHIFWDQHQNVKRLRQPIYHGGATASHRVKLLCGTAIIRASCRWIYRVCFCNTDTLYLLSPSNNFLQVMVISSLLGKYSRIQFVNEYFVQGSPSSVYCSMWSSVVVSYL